MSQYKGDAYLRLSYSADRSVESDSIANQKKLIEDFVAAHPDIELVSERVDDGCLPFPSAWTETGGRNDR